MITTAIEAATHRKPAEMQTVSAALRSKQSDTKNSSKGRFPPIENALIDILNNKRLAEAKPGT